jgi:hypothetical protein
MSRALFCLALLTSALTAGCAGNRENVADTATAAPTATVAAVAAAPAEQAAPGQPPTVVDGNQLAARAAATPICRDVLRRGSNVHVTECRTAEQWRIYQRAEAQAAGELVRRMQQGARPDDPNGNVFRRPR